MKFIKPSIVSGFTLIEVLLSVAIIAILAGLSAPIFATFQTHNDLDITTQRIADAVRRAQVYARGVNRDDQWGVRIQSTDATLYKGAGPGSGFDEVTTIPTGMSVSGLTDVLFSRLDGTATTTGGTTLTLTSNTNETRTITINAKGMVSY